MMKKMLGVAAALGLALAAFGGSAQAAPMPGVSKMLAPNTASDRPVVETVGWKRHRRCHWHHGRRHCKWRRTWVPGLSIQIGPKYRHHRHHHRKHHRRHR